MNYALFRPCKFSSETSIKFNKKSLAIEYKEVTKLLPKFDKCITKELIHKFVWNNRERIEKVWVKIIDFFSLFENNASTDDTFTACMKDSILKLWLLAVQYNICAGNVGNSWDALAGYIVKKCLINNNNPLFDNENGILDIFINDIKERSSGKLNIQQQMYYDYIFVSIFAAAYEKDKITSNLKRIFYLFLEQLKESIKNEQLYNTPLVDNEKWIKHNNKF